jgi:hypothetical protein
MRLIEAENNTIVKRTTGDDESDNINPGSIIHVIDKDEPSKKAPDYVPINIKKPEATDILPDHEVEKIMENYDPRLDLSRYRFPPVSILTDHKSGIDFDDREVFENKENIIKTLGDHKISIRQISATVGPADSLVYRTRARGIKSLETILRSTFQHLHWINRSRKRTVTE